jgi:hypothetical protein
VAPIYFSPHSTRLFPKGEGCSQIKLTGIASRCDWVLLSDDGYPRYKLINQKAVASPRTVFVSLRGGLSILEKFAESILPSIGNRFVLVTGSEDLTIPAQIDRRWAESSEQFREIYSSILGRSEMIHWFAENLDTVTSSKISAIPLGYVLTSKSNPYEASPAPSLANRDTLLFCSHRIREGVQWDERRRVTEWIRTSVRDGIVCITEEISEEEYEMHLRNSVFVLCVPGGGVDPCPKAFQALQNGAVPIVRSSSLDHCFKELPVWIVHDWCEIPVMHQELETRKLEFAETYPARHTVAQSLSIDHWWSKIERAAFES